MSKNGPKDCDLTCFNAASMKLMIKELVLEASSAIVMLSRRADVTADFFRNAS